MHQLLEKANLAVITSGTASFEAALHHTPHIVVYKTTRINYWIAKQIIKVKYLALPNLLLNQSCVPELIQNDFNPDRLIQEIQELNKDENQTLQIEKFERLQTILQTKYDSWESIWI